MRPLLRLVGSIQAWVVARHPCQVRLWDIAAMASLGWRPVAALGLRRWIHPQTTSDDVTLLADSLRAGSFSLKREARA